MKTAVFDHDKMVFHGSSAYQQNNLEQAFSELKAFHIRAGIVCSVNNESPLLSKSLKKISQHIVNFSSGLKLPLKNKYESPETLGNDRLAMAVGATLMFPEQNVLIVDAGTCLTFDIVNHKNEYLGGSIHPGLSMRFKSLNDYTARLPLVSFSPDYNKLTGNNTQNSILSGVQYAYLQEVKQFIQLYKKSFPQLIIIITGGDGKYLAENLKMPIIADDFFLLKSLNKILLLNV